MLDGSSGSTGGEPLYRAASLSVSSKRLPGTTQRALVPSLKEVVRDKVLSFLGKRPRWADPGSRLLPAGRTANRQSGSPPVVGLRHGGSRRIALLL